MRASEGDSVFSLRLCELNVLDCGCLRSKKVPGSNPSNYCATRELPRGCDTKTSAGYRRLGNADRLQPRNEDDSGDDDDGPTDDHRGLRSHRTAHEAHR